VPELPEVEAVCRAVRRAATGRRIVALHASPRLCAPQTPGAIARAVCGKRLRSVERRGKNILLHLDGISLWMHLRMTGHLFPAGPGLESGGYAARVLLDNGRCLLLEDPRRLAVMRAAPPQKLSAMLGPLGVDPLSLSFTPERLEGLGRASRAAVKNFLMNQRRVAGLGNIYSAEALFRAGINPRTITARLGRRRWGRLHASITSVLAEALESGRRAYRRPGGLAVGETFRCAVYGREGLPCFGCRRRIRRIAQSGRSSYFCPGCQR